MANKAVSCIFLGLYLCSLQVTRAQQSGSPWDAERKIMEVHHIPKEYDWEYSAMRAAQMIESPWLAVSARKPALFSIDFQKQQMETFDSVPRAPPVSMQNPTMTLPTVFGDAAPKISDRAPQNVSQGAHAELQKLRQPTPADEYSPPAQGDSNASTRAHILLAAPCYGGMVTASFASSLLEASLRARDFPDFELSIKLLPGDSLITRARNTLVALFLGTPHLTHLLFVDTDITFSLHNILRLLERSKKSAIVTAPYPKKGLMFPRLIAYIKDALAKDPQHPFTEEELQDSMIDYVFNPLNEEVVNRMHPGTRMGRLRVEDGFVRVDNAGTGFMMVRRDVLEGMKEAYSDLYYKNDISAYASERTNPHFYGFFDTMIDPHSRRLLSEDYAFCRRAQAIGYDVWMDLTADLQHSGNYIYDGNFSKNFIFEQPEVER